MVYAAKEGELGSWGAWEEVLTESLKDIQYICRINIRIPLFPANLAVNFFPKNPAWTGSVVREAACEENISIVKQAPEKSTSSNHLYQPIQIGRLNTQEERCSDLAAQYDKYHREQSFIVRISTHHQNWKKILSPTLRTGVAFAACSINKRNTTILCVRKNGRVCIAGDGQGT